MNHDDVFTRGCECRTREIERDSSQHKLRRNIADKREDDRDDDKERERNWFCERETRVLEKKRQKEKKQV